MSPEVINGERYSYPTDVWAIGAILYEICFLKKAYEGKS
jgi:NIMA (never in mitosis gene a)-related kinase